MRYLSTQSGPYALLDDEDYALWSRFAWGVSDGGYPSAFFQVRPGRVYLLRLHRLIARPAMGQYVHHRNRRVFDARRENLLCVSAAEHADLHPDQPQLRAMAERRYPKGRLKTVWNAEQFILERAGAL